MSLCHENRDQNGKEKVGILGYELWRGGGIQKNSWRIALSLKAIIAYKFFNE